MEQWKYWLFVGFSFLWISCAADESDKTLPQIAPGDRIEIKNFEIEATDKDQVLLTWNALEGAEKYKILRKFESDEIYIIQEVVETNSYASFVYEEHYVFRIWALNASGQIFAESEDVFIDTTGPATPTNFKATVLSTSLIQLSWDPVPGALGYKIYRDAGYGGFSLYKQLNGAGVRFLTDANLNSGFNYKYKITSFSEFEHESVESGILSVDTYTWGTCSDCGEYRLSAEA